MTQQIWHIAADLMMSSNLKVAAARHGLDFRSITNLASLSETSLPAQVVAMFVDLQAPKLDLERLQSMVSGATNLKTICFYAQHVDEAALARGQAFGQGLVLTRGQLNRDVEKILASVSAAPNTESTHSQRS